MKKTQRIALVLVLLATMTVSAVGGETSNPPLQPVCNPMVEPCTPQNPPGAPQNSDTSAEATDTDTTSSASADIVVKLINLTLSLLG